MDLHTLISMRAELVKHASAVRRAVSLITGSKAKSLSKSIASYKDEASKLHRVADAGGLWKQLDDPRFNKRVRASAQRVGRAANKLESLHKRELKAVGLTRASLGTVLAAGAAGSQLKKK